MNTLIREIIAKLLGCKKAMEGGEAKMTAASLHSNTSLAGTKNLCLSKMESPSISRELKDYLSFREDRKTIV